MHQVSYSSAAFTNISSANQILKLIDDDLSPNGNTIIMVIKRNGHDFLYKECLGEYASSSIGDNKSKPVPGATIERTSRFGTVVEIFNDLRHSHIFAVLLYGFP